MPRALTVATLLLFSSIALGGQEASVLRLKAVVTGPDGQLSPAPRHAFLISDEPPTAAPRRIVTALDGTANVRLRPGDYTVESDQPLVFHGKAYLWTQHVTIVAGRDAALELTADNAEIEVADPAIADAPPEIDPAFLQLQWQDSVAAVWSPTAHGSAFLIDGSGLLATNQRVIGDATSVEVQLSAGIKVAAAVVAADSTRDVALLRINPAVVAASRSIPLECAQTGKPAALDGQELHTIGAPLRGAKRTTSTTDEFRLPAGSAGGPVFTATGQVVGITSTVDDSDGRDSRIVGIEAVCAVVESARAAIAKTPPPPATHLPVEPTRPFPADALSEMVQGRVGSLAPYQLSAADFEVAFMTPVHVAGARSRSERQGGSVAAAQRLFDFGNWSEYVADVPPLLLIRVTPKMVESFWMTVGRVAARTQGVGLPALKHVKTGFLRMQVFCDATEVTPIHPFAIEQRVSEKDIVREGLYVIDPGALGPHCAAVKLLLYSAATPQQGDSRTVDPRIVRQIWQDFAPYRE